MNAEELLDGLIMLTEKYFSVYRKTIIKSRVTVDLDETTFESIQHRESLLEHVGHLPVIASYNRM